MSPLHPQQDAVAIHESHTAQTLPTIAQRRLHIVCACTWRGMCVCMCAGHIVFETVPLMCGL